MVEKRKRPDGTEEPTTEAATSATSAASATSGALVVQPSSANAGALTTTTQASNKQIQARARARTRRTHARLRRVGCQVRGVQRTSTLFAPIMQLVGHGVRVGGGAPRRGARVTQRSFALSRTPRVPGLDIRVQVQSGRRVARHVFV